jgi:lipopolysaccharide biosynthesis regulator YciM
VDPGQEAVEGQLPASMTEEKATPEEQKEYERAMQALAQVLYNNPEVANAIVDQIDPNDKVSSTAKVSMLLIKQIDEKIQLDVNVVAEVTKETVGRIEELAEARHGIEYGGREHQVILGSTWEGIQKMFGMEKEEAEALMAGVGGEGLADLKQQYDGFLNG